MARPTLGIACVLFLAIAGLCRAESRVEGLSVNGQSQGLGHPDLVEMDLAARAAFGFRATGLGRRDTNELYFRMIQDGSGKPSDSRDQRSESGGRVDSESGLHLGLVGLDFDGSRGNAQSVRFGFYRRSPLPNGSQGVTEMSYQTGTFGGDPAGIQNKGGIRARVGIRQPLSSKLYGMADYELSPGRKRSSMPSLRVGMTF